MSEQENNGKQYFNREQLIEQFRFCAANDELTDIIKFIDESTATWSRHLVLNTHKKQTTETARYSLEDGPAILTVLLDRGDLEIGERAPQLQMIFSRLEDGTVAITPRIQGCMATSRLIDTFDQINRELLLGQTVVFTSAGQVTTYVEQVAAQMGTATGFRMELGDPRQALIEAGDPDPTVHYTTILNNDQVEVRVIAKDVHGDSLIGLIMLDQVGKDGRIQLEMSAKTRFNTASAQANELHQSKEFAPVWNDVRETRATPDAVIDAAEQALRPGVTKEAEAEQAVAPGAAVSMGDVSVTGRDEHMLKLFMQRLLDHGQLNVRDQRALRAFDDFVMGGEGLANADEWSYVASIALDPSESEDAILRKNNNAYIVIYDDSTQTDENTVIVIWQGRIENIKK